MPLIVFILGVIVLVSACSMTPKGGNHAQSGTTPSDTTQSSTEQNSASQPDGYVDRAIFTTVIRNREPTDNIRKLRNNQQKIYHFTEIRNMQGQQVKHRWIYKGNVMAEIEFNVKGPRWRVYSSKRLDHDWLGNWTVLTVDPRGNILSRNSFTYTQGKSLSVNTKPTRSTTNATVNTTARKTAKAPTKVSSRESYFDAGARKASELYDGLFGGD